MTRLDGLMIVLTGLLSAPCNIGHRAERGR